MSLDATAKFLLGLVGIFWGVGVLCLIAYVIRLIVKHSRRPNIF